MCKNNPTIIILKLISFVWFVDDVTAYSYLLKNSKAN